MLDVTLPDAANVHGRLAQVLLVMLERGLTSGCLDWGKRRAVFLMLILFHKIIKT